MTISVFKLIIFFHIRQVLYKSYWFNIGIDIILQYPLIAVEFVLLEVNIPNRCFSTILWFLGFTSILNLHWNIRESYHNFLQFHIITQYLFLSTTRGADGMKLLIAKYSQTLYLTYFSPLFFMWPSSFVNKSHLVPSREDFGMKNFQVASFHRKSIPEGI